MPIFEYQCRSCGAKFEKIINSATETAACKSCGSLQVDKLLSTFAVAVSSGSASASTPDPCTTCGARERGLCER